MPNNTTQVQQKHKAHKAGRSNANMPGDPGLTGVNMDVGNDVGSIGMVADLQDDSELDDNSDED
jgi:hypothetical protein